MSRRKMFLLILNFLLLIPISYSSEAAAARPRKGDGTLPKNSVPLRPGYPDPDKKPCSDGLANAGDSSNANPTPSKPGFSVPLSALRLLGKPNSIIRLECYGKSDPKDLPWPADPVPVLKIVTNSSGYGPYIVNSERFTRQLAGQRDPITAVVLSIHEQFDITGGHIMPLVTEQVEFPWIVERIPEDPVWYNGRKVHNELYVGPFRDLTGRIHPAENPLYIKLSADAVMQHRTTDRYVGWGFDLENVTLHGIAADPRSNLFIHPALGKRLLSLPDEDTLVLRPGTKDPVREKARLKVHLIFAMGSQPGDFTDVARQGWEAFLNRLSHIDVKNAQFTRVDVEDILGDQVTRARFPTGAAVYSLSVEGWADAILDVIRSTGIRWASLEAPTEAEILRLVATLD